MLARVLGCGLAWTSASLPAREAHASPESARILVREAEAHARAQDDDVAVRRYTEALSLDPTFGEAYVGLAELRARMGELAEAERVYSVGLAHLPSFAPALRGRARARRALGRNAEARADLQEYVDAADAGGADLDALRELAEWLGKDGLAPAQLAVWRQIRTASHARGDVASARHARTMILALQLVVGSADPVSAPASRDPVRRVIAESARRR